MIHPDFAHITTWVFDLDHTLYPPSVRLFDQIETKMVDYVQTFLNVDRQTANELRSKYWASHGTTLAGLMDIHGMDPHEFLEVVHDIDFSVLPKAPQLSELISKLPGRKLIYTNGTAPYARNVLTARGLLDHFADIYGVEDAEFRPKPERHAFETVFAKAGFDPQNAAMFEDDPRNLEVPKAMGMRTILVAPHPIPKPYIDHHTNPLEDILSQVVYGPS